jgi:hypothetical protein
MEMGIKSMILTKLPFCRLITSKILPIFKNRSLVFDKTTKPVTISIQLASQILSLKLRKRMIPY